jgi:hypothetical protein
VGRNVAGCGVRAPRSRWALAHAERHKVQVPAMLAGENTLDDFTAYPSIYSVPPERDCRQTHACRI